MRHFCRMLIARAVFKVGVRTWNSFYSIRRSTPLFLPPSFIVTLSQSSPSLSVFMASPSHLRHPSGCRCHWCEPSLYTSEGREMLRQSYAEGPDEVVRVHALTGHVRVYNSPSPVVRPPSVIGPERRGHVVVRTGPYSVRRGGQLSSASRRSLAYPTDHRGPLTFPRERAEFENFRRYPILSGVSGTDSAPVVISDSEEELELSEDNSDPSDAAVFNDRVSHVSQNFS